MLFQLWKFHLVHPSIYKHLQCLLTHLTNIDHLQFSNNSNYHFLTLRVVTLSLAVTIPLSKFTPTELKPVVPSHSERARL